ncbi:MAG: hypothetical protein WA906_00350, partial [Pacificimonas sp.]
MILRALAKTVSAPLRAQLRQRRLPQAARMQVERDRVSLPPDPGPAAVIGPALGWIMRAQDQSASADGGVARHYSLIDGWAPTYPETTGYIVPTLIDQAARRGDEALLNAARRMTTMLMSAQFPDGGLPGGMVDQQPQVPVTFNTGQILLGFAAAAQQWREPAMIDAMTRASDFLASSQDEDGCWRSHRTPFAKAEDKAYETHVSWGLFEAARVSERADWGAAGLRQTDWAIGRMRSNGFMDECCLTHAEMPLTHTLGYA